MNPDIGICGETKDGCIRRRGCGAGKGVFHVIKREAENMKFRGPDFDSEEATTLEL